MPAYCPDEGTWRAYLDGQGSDAQREALGEHLQGCAICAEKVDALAANATIVAQAFVQVRVPGPATSAAWRTFSSRQLAGRLASPVAIRSSRPASTVLGGMRYLAHLMTWRLEAMSRNSRIRWQPALAGVLLAALLLSMVTIAPLRAAAGQLLDIFRVRRLAVLQVQTDRLQQFDQYADQVFGKPQVDRAEPVEVADAAQAGQLAGFRVLVPGFLPNGLSTPDRFVVEGAGHARAQVNLAAARTILQAANLPTDAIPADRDTAEINATIKPGVAIQYQNGDRELAIVQGQSPEVDVPAGLDLNRIGEVGLQFFGLSAAEAQRFSQSIDWSSTLVLPVPAAMGSVQEVSVRGTTGYVITEASPDRSGRRHTVVVWQESGILYAVAGSYDNTQLLQVADSLR